MRYLEKAPHPALHPFVECFWLLERSPDDRPQVVTPDGHPELLVHFGDPVDHLAPEPVAEPPSLFFGQIDRPLRLRASGYMGVVGARFTPAGAHSLVSRGAAELAGRPTALAELWGEAALELEERVHGAADDLSRLAALEDALLRRRTAAPPTDPRVERAVAALRASRGALPIERLARTCALSRRQLERRFGERVGLAPKRFARITRFQNVLRLAARRRRLGWVGIAAASGYFDQAHLIRDFRRFAGAPPRAWFARQHPLSETFQSPERLERLLGASAG